MGLLVSAITTFVYSSSFQYCFIKASSYLNFFLYIKTNTWQSNDYIGSTKLLEKVFESFLSKKILINKLKQAASNLQWSEDDGQSHGALPFVATKIQSNKIFPVIGIVISLFF